MNNKIINSIIVIATIAIASLSIFVACTNEDDFDSSRAVSNKKNAIQGDEKRPYPEYEMINYSDKETKTMLEDFDKIVNDPSLIIPDMPIEKALYIMETYINYGVIDQANSVATEPNIENRTFDFTVPIQEGKVLGSELKGIFQNFAVNLLTTMRGKAIPLSDMYVKDITPTYVTFGLDIRPIPPGPDYIEPRYYFPEFYKTGDDIIVPEGVESSWSKWYHVDHATPWEPWPENIPLDPPNEVFEHNVYRYSKKPTSLIYNYTSRTYFTYYTGIKDDLRFYPYQIRNYTDTYNVSPLRTEAYYNNIGIQDTLIPIILELVPEAFEFLKHPVNLYGDRVICDYAPHIFYKELQQGNPYDVIHMYVHNITIGYEHKTQPIMRYITALTIADIHPEL